MHQRMQVKSIFYFSNTVYSPISLQYGLDLSNHSSSLGSAVRHLTLDVAWADKVTEPYFVSVCETMNK
jgi:hypothetical protein